MNAWRLGFLFSILFVACGAQAHTPLFPRDNHQFTAAFVIGNPAKSWVAYSAVRTAAQRDYYRFQASQGDEIRIKLLAARNPAETGFLPSFVLAGPGLVRRDSLPPGLGVPPEYGSILVPGIQPKAASYEPFAQGWFYDLANLSVHAPAAGVYHLIVFDTSGRTGGYAVTVGYLEGWTPMELIALPWNIRRIQLWEGQNLIDGLIPFLATLALGSLWLFLRRSRGKTPRTLSQGFAAFSFLAFLGSAAGSIHQMLLASRVAPIHRSDLIITLIAAAIPILLGITALRYGLRISGGDLMLWRIALIAVAIIGVLLFTGLYLGPALCLIAALAKSSEKIERRRLES